MPSSTLQAADSKSKKKKAAAAKTLEPAVVASKDSSALNSPRNGPEDGAAELASTEKEHIRETQKYVLDATAVLLTSNLHPRHIRNITKKLVCPPCVLQ
jgi:hypothetical protein